MSKNDTTNIKYFKEVPYNVKKSAIIDKSLDEFQINALDLCNRLRRFWTPVRGPVRCTMKD